MEEERENTRGDFASLKRRFEEFASSALGTEVERKRLVAAVEAMVLAAISGEKPRERGRGGQGGDAPEFPGNAYAQAGRKALDEFLRGEGTAEYLKTHGAVAENVQTDLLEFLRKTQERISAENPFLEEERFVASRRNRSAAAVEEDLAEEPSPSEREYGKLPSVDPKKRGEIAPSDVDFGFYRKECAKAKAASGKGAAERAEVLRRNFVADLERNLFDRKNKWELERLERARKKFVEELRAKLRNYRRLETALLPFLGDGDGNGAGAGLGWGLSAGNFRDTGFEALRRYAGLLERDKSLQELAEILGKHANAQDAFEKEMRDQTEIETEWRSRPAYRGEIKGIQFSDDVPAALPSELALLKNPAAVRLFRLKFAQKRLLSFRFANRAAFSRERTVREEVAREKKEPKGPIVVCVDTSGSMSGTPENIAKTVAFALAKVALREGRGCFLISFSIGIKTFDFSLLKGGDALDGLADFLKMSFHGGTDAVPALKEALRQLGRNKWKNADVLMISDFEMDDLDSRTKAAIKAEQEKNTCFCSLVVGRGDNANVVSCFDRNWFYDAGSPGAPRRLVEQLHAFRTRRDPGGEAFAPGS
ncbi:MAG: VWA domain-containing protein [Fibrobacterales bacterium]|nr:VWA domain-containing protein [Fibrobacterales bacterium]